jgi:hypothetical protein
LPEGRVVEVRSELVGSFSTRICRLHVRYDGAPPSSPASFVTKSSIPERPDRIGELFANEIRFYAELAHRVPARTPCFHHGHVDESTRRGLLLIEDVTDLGPTDWIDGPSERHATLAVVAMAKLHAAWTGEVEDIDWVPSFADEVLIESFEEAYAHNWPRWRNFFHEIVPDFSIVGDALRGRVASSHRALAYESTLLHGDAHAENMPLAPTADGGEVVLLDWAGPRRGNPGVDLGFFIPMSFPSERRAAVERFLVSQHHETMKRSGAKPEIDPWLAYRRGVLRRISRIVEIADSWDAAALSSLRMIFQRCACAAVELKVGELIE